MLQTSRDELQSHSNQQSGTISELQTKNSNLTLENETLRRKIEDLNHVISRLSTAEFGMQFFILYCHVT